MTDGNTSFVDRDMYMRFRGGGVGHVTTRIEDPEAEVAIVDSDGEGEAETVIPPVVGGEVEGDGDNEDQESGSESEDEYRGREDEEGL